LPGTPVPRRSCQRISEPLHAWGDTDARMGISTRLDAAGCVLLPRESSRGDGHPGFFSVGEPRQRRPSAADPLQGPSGSPRRRTTRRRLAAGGVVGNERASRRRGGTALAVEGRRGWTAASGPRDRRGTRPGERVVAPEGGGRPPRRQRRLQDVDGARRALKTGTGRRGQRPLDTEGALGPPRGGPRDGRQGGRGHAELPVEGPFAQR
jgi:hypothetical protein